MGEGNDENLAETKLAAHEYFFLFVTQGSEERRENPERDCHAWLFWVQRLCGFHRLVR